MKLKVLYSCDLCNLDKVTCEVDEREDDEDVKDWFEKKMTPAIADDHRARSPHCYAEKISKVMIPISGADKIGGIVKN